MSIPTAYYATKHVPCYARLLSSGSPHSPSWPGPRRFTLPPSILCNHTHTPAASILWHSSPRAEPSSNPPLKLIFF